MSEATDLTEIPRRVPVIDEEAASKFPLDEIDRQWDLTTEAIRRNLITKPEIRKALIPFCAQPLSESLPGQLLSALSSTDERVKKLATRYKDMLPAYLGLETVPDEMMNPDISQASGLLRPEKMAATLASIYSVNGPGYKENLQELINSGTFLRGITAEERLMVIKRFKFARDAKILALGAEILDQESFTPDENGEVVLPSGIKIGMDTEQADQRSDLLNPHLWEKRRQIKDRVYEISVGDRNYILKEKKTARHKDTRRGGHKEGHSSEGEFAVARHFIEHGKLNRGNISVDWEKPIGFVNYPDGFQFAIFEYEKDLVNDHDIVDRLAEAIGQNRERFEQEYEFISGLAQKYKDSPEVLAPEDRKSERGLRRVMQLLRTQKTSAPQLSFEDFSRVKALRMERQARELMQESVFQNEYHNSDTDGYAFRVNTDEGVKLEIVGFEFENFEKVSPERARGSQRSHQIFEKEWQSRNGIGFLWWNNGQSVTRIQKAGYFAMLETEGILDKGIE